MKKKFLRKYALTILILSIIPPFSKPLCGMELEEGELSRGSLARLVDSVREGLYGGEPDIIERGECLLIRRLPQELAIQQYHNTQQRLKCFYSYYGYCCGCLPIFILRWLGY